MPQPTPEDEALAARLCPLIGAAYQPPAPPSEWRAHKSRLWVRGDRARAAAGHVDYLSLKRSGNFGNNLIQLVYALAVAEAADIPAVFHPFAAFTNGPSLVTRLRAGSEPRNGAGLKSTFIVPTPFDAARTLTGEAMLDIIDRHLRPAFRWRPARAALGRLVLNLRGGEDLFGDATPHPGYGQPPLSYYITAAEHLLATQDITAIDIVHQDDRNPVLRPLAEWAGGNRPLRMISDGPKGDAGALLAADHIVMGTTSFTEAAVLLSCRLQTLSSFGKMHLPTAIAAAVPLWRQYTDAQDAYQPGKHWRGSDDERAQMMAYPAEALSAIEVVSQTAQARHDANRPYPWRIFDRYRTGRFSKTT